MRYLITGGAGFIGSNFLKYMIKKYPVDYFVCLDLLTYASSLDSLTDIIDHPNLKFIQGDICDEKLVDSLFKNESFDYVINFAAESHVDRSFIYPELFYQTNVEGTRILLDASARYNIKRFHQVSTDEVYGELTLFDDSVAETAPLNPTSPYSKSKAIADELVLKYCKENSLDVTISRSANNYGIYQHPEKLIPKIVKMALNNENITIYGDGNNVRNWIYVLDHCKAIDLIIHKGVKGEIYNVGTNNEFKNKEIIDKILAELKINEYKFTYINGRVYDDKRYSLNCDKIKKELGWQTESNFASSFHETVHWFKTNISWIKMMSEKQ